MDLLQFSSMPTEKKISIKSPRIKIFYSILYSIFIATLLFTYISFLFTMYAYTDTNVDLNPRESIC